MKCFRVQMGALCLVLSGLVLSAGCNPIESQLGSAAAVLKYADKVSTVRMKNLYDRVGTGNEDGPKLHGYPMLRNGPSLSSGQIADWQALLLDSASYKKSRTHGKVFSPVMALQFKSGGEKVDVLICFSGKEVQFVQGGEVIVHEDFSPAYDEFVNLATKIFPGDEQIP